MKTCLIALFLLLAVGCKRADAGKSFQETKIKAEKGDAEAQYNLGKMYHDGKDVAKDDVEAVKWFRKAADQGYAAGQNGLGFMYVTGDGVPKDEAEAVKWFRKAADQRYAKGQFNLGLMYDNGQGVPKDEAEAYKWWLLAGAQGDEDAKKNISFIEGNITPAQRTEGQRRAREWKPRKP